MNSNRSDSADQVSDWRANRSVSVRLLRSFPRSAAVVFTSIAVAITLDPLSALTQGVVVWFVLSVILSAIRLLLPNFVDLGAWLACSFVVLPIAAWFLKWPIVVGSGVVALVRGAPFGETLYVLGGVLAVDVVLSVFLQR